MLAQDPQWSGLIRMMNQYNLISNKNMWPGFYLSPEKPTNYKVSHILKNLSSFSGPATNKLQQVTLFSLTASVSPSVNENNNNG